MKNTKKKIFFYSDPHYGHDNVIGFCKNRKYNTIEEMNEDYIKKYNQMVPEDGVVFWLGDCFFKTSKDNAKNIMDQLNGTKVLIRGNHDWGVNAMYKLGFSAVVEYAEMYISGLPVKLKHFPSKYTSSKIKNWLKFNKLTRWLSRVLPVKPIYIPRYFNRFPEQDGKWLLHGHTHSTDKVDYKHKMIHVGVDAWGGRPVPFSSIESIINRTITQKKKD